MAFARAGVPVAFIAVGCVAVDPMAPASAAGGGHAQVAVAGADDGALAAAHGPGAPQLGVPEPDRAS